MPALSPRLSFALFAVLGVAGCAAPATWTAYGAPQRGLQLRVKAPRAVEEGVRLPVRVHFRYERDGLPADAKSIANGLPGAFLALELTPDAGGPTVRVDPYDPTGGMPDFLFPLPSHALDGTPVPAERIEFPLAMV